MRKPPDRWEKGGVANEIIYPKDEQVPLHDQWDVNDVVTCENLKELKYPKCLQCPKVLKLPMLKGI